MTRPIAVRLIDPRGHRFGGALSVVLLVVATILDIPLARGRRRRRPRRQRPVRDPVLDPRPALADDPARPQARPAGEPGARVRTPLRPGARLRLPRRRRRPPRGRPAAARLDPGHRASAVLQTLLAATGYCLGCKLYVLHWWVPDAFDRIIGRVLRRSRIGRLDHRSWRGTQGDVRGHDELTQPRRCPRHRRPASYGRHTPQR